MVSTNLTTEYAGFLHETSLNFAVINNSTVLERNLYRIVESTLEVLRNYDEKRLYESDNETYSNLIRLVDANVKEIVPWENRSYLNGSYFLAAASVFSKQHHCRICGKTIESFEEYDLYFLALLIEYEYLAKLRDFDRSYKKHILKYWFINFKVCSKCDFIVIKPKHFKYIQDFNNSLGGFNEQSGDDTDWILSKIDYLNNVKTVLQHLVSGKHISVETMPKLHQYLKILDEDIIYKLQVKLNLLISEKNFQETASNKPLLSDSNLNYHIILIENTLKMVNNFLLTKVKNKLPKDVGVSEVKAGPAELPIDRYHRELREKEQKEQLLQKEVELSNKLIIFREQIHLLEEQLKVLISRRQFKDVRDLKANLELLSSETLLIESELAELNKRF